MNKAEKIIRYTAITADYNRLRKAGRRKMEAYQIIATTRNMTERRIRGIVKGDYVHHR